MSKGKPSQPDMPLRDKQQMNLDTERSTHIGMEGQSRSSHKHLLLQVWCSLLTVAMLVMAALLASIKAKSAEDSVSMLKPNNPTVSPLVNTFMTPLKSVGSSLSYIQIIKSVNNHTWEVTHGCHPCSLSLKNDSIYCKEDSLYFIYAQVTFTKQTDANEISKTNKYVILKKEPTFGVTMRKLVEGTFPSTTEGSVWVAKIVNLRAGDTVSLNITAKYLKDSTFWGAYQLH